MEYYYYDGLRIQTYEALHIKCFEIIKAHFHNKIKVLDIATGEGALAKRLKDGGYDVAVTTWNDKVKYRSDDIKVHNINLDNSFDETCFDGEKFACVTAIEIIEHLASPLNFLLNLRKILLTNAIVIISTPNVESLLSRMQILYRGYPNSFSNGEVRHNRHISILNHHICEYLFELSGYSIINLYYLPEESYCSNLSPRNILKFLLLKSISKFIKGLYRGASQLYLLTNDKPILIDQEYKKIY